MEKIDLNKIRGQYIDLDENGKACAGGNDTIPSIEMVAEKVNEIIDWIESKKDQLL